MSFILEAIIVIVAAILTALFMAVGLNGFAALTILIAATLIGLIMWLKSERWLAMALLAPLVAYFIGLYVAHWVTGLNTNEWSSFFLFNGLNPVWHWTPVFKAWGFWLYVIAVVLWELARLPRTEPTRSLAYARFCRFITGFLLVVVVCSLNWTSLHLGDNAKVAHSEAISIKQPIVNADDTVTLEVVKAPKA